LGVPNFGAKGETSWGEKMNMYNTHKKCRVFSHSELFIFWFKEKHKKVYEKYCKEYEKDKEKLEVKE